MSDRPSALDQVLDIFLYAPIGLVLTARDQLPNLVEKGRQRASGQVMVARMVGELAVRQGQREAEKWLRQAVGRTADDVPPVPDAPPAPASPPPSAAAPARPSSAPSGADLAIPGYDALSASQVVQRLEGLSPDELEAVRVYETATRHRRTILGRVAQLQSGVS